MTGFLVRKAATAALRSSTGSKKGPEKRKRSHLPTGRALLLGAGLMTAGRWLARGRGAHITETVRLWVDEVVEELENDEQPEDEEYTEEDEGEPEDEADEDFDEEPEADADAPSEEEEVPADAE